MNHYYRLVFNQTLQVWQAVAEFAKARGKSKSQSENTFVASAFMPKLKKLVVCIAFGQAFAASGVVNALPVGADVQFGQATFQTNGNNLTINQGTRQLIANWQSFDIAANESVQLLQPNQGVALFRVVGPEASQIYGSLSATGSLFLINPNGVLFGQGAQVDVGSLVATSMNISNTDFLNGRYQFNADGSTGSVINQGVIKAADGGYIVLLGNEVKNSGTLITDNGSVVMGSAQSAMLDFYGNGLVKARLSGDALNALVEQTGTIQADGGAVQLATNSRSSAVNVSGLVQANSLVERNGVIRLEGGDNAKVSVSGTLNAAGKQTGNKGGTIEVTGEQVALFKGAKLDASGDLSGGTVLVGGDYQGKNAQVYNSRTTYVDKDASINVDAKNSGNGGKAIVWANEITRYYGSISAKGGASSGNGGFVEVSGKQTLDFIGQVDLSARNGIGGRFLLDPTDITFNTTTQASPPNNANGTPDLAFADLPAATVIQISDITGFSEAFFQASNNITVSNPITMGAGNSIRLEANNNITVSGAITTSGVGSITMTADADTSGVGTLAVNAGLATGGGVINLTGANVTSNATGTINAGGGAVTVNASTGASTFSKVIAGTGSFNKNGAGTLTLSGANTYTGATNINVGTLTLGAASRIADASVVTVVGGAIFNLAGFAETVGSLAGAGNVTLGAGTLTTGGNGTTTTYSGVMSGTGGLSKAGAGVMTLSGANTYTGATTIVAGSLALSGGSAISDTSAVNLSVAGANLTLNNSETLGSIAGVAGTTADLGANILTVGGLNSSTTLTGVVSGAGGGLTKVGTGTLTLAGANTYTGATVINAGTLQANTATALGTVAGDTTINSGATLAMNGTFTSAENLVMNNATLSRVSGDPTLTGTVNLASGTNTLTGAAGTMTLSGIVSGAGNLTKTGAGTLVLSGSNTYTGATTVSVGTLVAANNTALGTTAAGTTVANGAALALQGGITIGAEALSITGTGVSTNGALQNISGNNTYGGTVTLAGNSEIQSDAGTLTLGAANAFTGATRTLTLDGVGNTAINGTITTTTGGVTKNGLGTAILAAANTYTGTTTINAGVLQYGANDAILTGAVTVNNGGTYNLNGFSDSIGALTVNSGATGGTVATGAGTLTLTGNISSTGGASNASISGNLAFGVTRSVTTTNAADGLNISAVISGAGGLTKAGNGTLTLSGSNTYTGATNINAGVFSVNTLANGGVASNIGQSTNAAANLVLGGGTLQYTGGTVSTNRNFTLTAGTTSTVDVANPASNLTISGASTATTGALSKAGAGTLTLSGNNLYTGATNINAGTLALGAANRIADASALTVAGGATFNLNGFAETVGSIAGAGNITLGNNATLTSGNASNTTFSGVISGTGTSGLTKVGTGTLTLSGANTYNGTTSINAGTLSASNSAALGNTAGTTTVVSGATLNVDNVTLATEAITINGNGVAGAGALTATNAGSVNGTVSTASNSLIGTTSAASTLTLNGAVTAANNLGTVGLGDVSATNTANNFSTVNINGANDVTLSDTNAITLGGGASNLTGNLTVRANAGGTGGNVTVANNVSTTGGDITLAGSNFINTAGAGALSASGRWLVYSTAPAGNTFGGLASGSQAIWGRTSATATPETGNRYVFANSPTVTVTSTNQTKTYGQDGAPVVANAFTSVGFMDASAFGNVFTQDTMANALSGSAISIGSPTNANVGSYAIDVTPITATTGYTLAKNSTGNLTVNPAALTISANNQTKTYGSTFNFAGTEFTNTALQNGETIGSVSLASLGAVNTANVGGYGITASAATGGTFTASNYTLNYIDGAMTVNPAVVNLAGTRTYNGTTAFNPADFGTFATGVLGQTLNVTGGGSVASANAQAAQTLTTGSLALADGSGLASNYTLTGGTHTGTINQANLTVSTSNVTKTYDGTLAATGTAIVTGGTLFSNASNGNTLDSLSGGTFAYTDANAGIGNKTVATSGVTVNDGNGGGNYNVTYADNTTSTINKANLTISTMDVTKTYDKTTSAAGVAIVTGGTLFNNVSNGNAPDTISGGTFAFTDVNAGIGNKTVTTGGVTVIDGNLGDNYNVSYADNTTSTINQRAITVSAATDTKTYNGNTTSAGAPTVTVGSIAAGDTGSLSQTFDNKNAGTNKTLTATGSVSDGNGGNNYAVTFVADNTGVINKANLGITANPGQSKTFGAVDPLLFTFTIGGSGLFGGDTLLGALDRLPGETVGNYAINQGTLDAGSNYTINYIGSTFAILAPGAGGGVSGNGSPRDAAGLGSLLANNDRPTQSLAILNIAAPGAGDDTDVENSAEACDANKDPKLNNPNTSIIFNFGMKLPKGVKPVCI